LSILASTAQLTSTENYVFFLLLLLLLLLLLFAQICFDLVAVV
jgi:hypothetical protein